MLKKYKDAQLEKLHTDTSDDLKDFANDILGMTKEDYDRMPNTYIYGDYRRGKTWMLHALINYFKKKFGEKSIGYVDSPKLYEYFKSNEIWKLDYTWWQYYQDKKILMLDDLGQEYRSGSGFSETRLENFLRWRFGHGRITFIATNLEVDKITSKYGESFAEFILGEYYPVDVEGTNMSELFKNLRNGKTGSARKKGNRTRRKTVQRG